MEYLAVELRNCAKTAVLANEPVRTVGWDEAQRNPSMSLVEGEPVTAIESQRSALIAWSW